MLNGVQIGFMNGQRDGRKGESFGQEKGTNVATLKGPGHNSPQGVNPQEYRHIYKRMDMGILENRETR